MSRDLAVAPEPVAAPPPTPRPSKASILLRGAISAARRNVLVLSLFLIIGYLVIPPVIVMVWKSFIPGGSGLDGSASFSAYTDVFSGTVFRRTAYDTAVFVIGSTALGLALGVLMAWLVARTNTPGRSLAYAITFLGFAIPGIVKIIGWILLFGPGNGALNNLLGEHVGTWAQFNVQSLPGIVVIEALLSIPLVFTLMVGPFQAINPSLEEAAWVSGANRWQVARRVTFPLLVPALASVLTLLLIRTVQAFEVPLLLGTPGRVHTFTTEIYEKLRTSFRPDYAGAAAYGAGLIVVLTILIWLQHRLTRNARRYQVITGKSYRSIRRDLGWRKYLGVAFYVILLLAYLVPSAYVVLASFAPRIGDVWHALTHAELTGENYRTLLNYPGFKDAARNSFVIAVITALATLVLTGAASWVSVRRSKAKSSLMLDQLASAPLVVPGIVLGVAVLLFYLYVPIPFYGTIWIIIVAFIAAYSPYGMRYLKPAFLSVSVELEEAARVSGARQSSVFRKVLMPLTSNAALGTGLYVFFGSFRELAIPAMVVTAATPVLATQLLDTLVNGNLNLVSALGTFIMAVSVLAAIGAFRVTTRLSR